MNIDFDRLKYSLTGEYEEVMLERKLEELQQRIDRAIEYIKEGTREDMPNKRFRDEKRVILNPVLEILKGEDKE